MLSFNENSEPYLYECFDIITIDESKINDNTISKIFLKYIDRTIYVTKEDRLSGIITYGNFKRYKEGKGELINRHFTYVTKEDFVSIHNGFKKSDKIKAIPLIDHNNQIIKEFIKKSHYESFKPLISFDEIKEALIEIKLFPYDKIYIILDILTENETEETIKIFYDTNQRIAVISADDVKLLDRSLAENCWKICIYNFCTSSRQHLIETIYKQHVKIMFSLERKLNIEMLYAFYKSVGLISVSERDENTADNIIPIYINNLIWNEEKQRYEYIKKIVQMPECIFSFFPFETPYLYYNEKYIPIISKFMIGPVRHPETRPADIDIAYNIIPKLLEHYISCIVINNPENEKEQLMQFINASSSNHIDSNSYWCYDKKFWNEDIMQNISKLWVSTIRHGYFSFRDCHEKGITYVNNERYVFDNPQTFQNTLYLFGPCLMASTYVEDKYSLGNLLRDKISRNYFIHCFGVPWEIYNLVIREQRYKSGDIVVILTNRPEYYKRKDIPVYSILEAYKKMPNLKYNVCHDYLLHVNESAMLSIAEEFYQILEKTDVLTKNTFEVNSEITFYQKKFKKDIISPGLLIWLENVKQYISNNYENKKIGSIVMNGNPFTYGHQYLIEESKKQVDLLYIFVVEEDKSFFKFSDRFQMIKDGVKDFSNVVVIPSGQFIISTITLPGYFQKDSQPNLTLDATNDLEIFSTIIAKQFHINYRFAGEEPIDAVTRQYNIAMSEILPSYGIKFIEIPRKEIAHQIVSASLVRKYLKEKNYIMLKRFVPITTLQILEKNYFV